MIVSNFEISRGASGRSFQHTFYQLQVTNMADNEIEFLAETHIGVRQGIDSLLSNVTTKLLNVNVTDNFSFRRRGGEYVQGVYFRVAPKASAIFEISQTTEEGQLLGHIVLRVPPIRSRNHLVVTTQQADVVKVLLAASRQDRRGPFSAGIQDFEGRVLYRTPVGDWFSTQSIEISTGQAENELEPEGFGFKTTVLEFAEHIREAGSADLLSHGALRLADEDKIPALVDLLTALDSDERELKTLNKLLTESGARVRIHHP